MPYCNECGAELKESDAFCPKCGHPTDHSDSNNVKDKLNSDSLDAIKGKINSEDLGAIKGKISSDGVGSIMDKLNMKIVGAALIALLLIIGGLALFGGSGDGGDLADVTYIDIIPKTNYGVGMYNSLTDSNVTDRIYTEFAFSFMPKEDIDRVTGLKFSNLELTYSNGTVDHVGSQSFDNYNTYYASEEYSYKSPFRIPQDDVAYAYNHITHVKGQIIVQKADGESVVIAHVDQDVNLESYP